MYSRVMTSIAYLKVAKRGACMIDINQTGHGIHVIIYTYNKTLCCTPKTNTKLYANYILILKINDKLFFKKVFVCLTTQGDVQGRVRNLVSGLPMLLFRCGTIQEMESEMYKRPLFTQQLRPRWKGITHAYFPALFYVSQ